MDQPESVADFYRLLSRLWLEEVDGDLLRYLSADPLRAALTANNVPVPQVENGTLDVLAEDYCQLFIGPAQPLRPIQSVWQEEQLEGKPTQSMRDTYLPLLPDFTHPESIPADHLGIQLSVMAEFIDSGITDLAQRFYHEHLGWTEPLTTAATQRAHTDFYRSIITLTATFLTSEASLWT